MTKSIPPQVIRQIFVIVSVLLLGGLIFSKLLPYFSGILGAITLYVVLQKWMVTMVDKKKWKSSLAAITLMIGSFFCILVPFGGVIFLLGNKLGKAVKNSEDIVYVIKTQLNRIDDQLGFDVSSDIDAEAISELVGMQMQKLIGTTANAFLAIALMYFLLYFMLTKHKQMRHALNIYIPMNQSNLNEIGTQARSMVRSNAIGIPLVGLAKGIVGLIGFLIFGIEDPFFWFAILTITSMIPFIGTLMGILPVFFVTLATDNLFASWGILIYGVIIVGITDHIIRLYALKKLENVHPLITLIGVIIGVPLFGFIGLIFGPLLVILFLVILKIYKKEYGMMDPAVFEENI